MKTIDIELLIANYFNKRLNMIIPNISWGLGLHECDILIITKDNYCYEIEIKTSKADLKKDAKKYHRHYNEKIKKLYFAIPESLIESIDLIPERAGILICSDRVKVLRRAKINKAIKLTDKEVLHAGKLASMRIWNLKKKLKLLLQ